MTERRGHAVCRHADTLRIGPSSVAWRGDTLVFQIDEWTVPWPARLRGEVRVKTLLRHDHAVTLAPQHRWHPIAPLARVEVDLDAPTLRWSGTGYLDANHGDAPLEQAFSGWDWTRAHLPDGSSTVFYDLTDRDGTPHAIALQFEPDGSVTPALAPPLSPLPRTAWRLPRSTRSDADAPARLRQTLTDAPFYARSVVNAVWGGRPVTAMHESLSLRRFDSRWVQAMLPFRMPREFG